MEPFVLEEVQLTPEHVPTGNTRHYVGGSLMATPSTVRIARYTGDPGYYLLYLDENGQEQTDTWHENIADARHQATYEFRVQPHEWTVLRREQDDP
jgi:hypothetical protein